MRFNEFKIFTVLLMMQIDSAVRTDKQVAVAGYCEVSVVSLFLTIGFVLRSN